MEAEAQRQPGELGARAAPNLSLARRRDSASGSHAARKARRRCHWAGQWTREEALPSTPRGPAPRRCHDTEGGLPETRQVPADTPHGTAFKRLRAGAEGRRHVPPLFSEGTGQGQPPRRPREGRRGGRGRRVLLCRAGLPPHSAARPARPCALRSTPGEDRQGGRPRREEERRVRGGGDTEMGAGSLAAGAWSDGTHCVFCMLFSIPFHPLPELSVHGLQGNDPQPVSGSPRPLPPPTPPRDKLGLPIHQPAAQPLGFRGLQGRTDGRTSESPRCAGHTLYGHFWRRTYSPKPTDPIRQTRAQQWCPWASGGDQAVVPVGSTHSGAPMRKQRPSSPSERPP